MFGTTPRLNVTHSSHADQNTRLKALETACRDYSTIAAELRMLEGLRARVPPAAQFNIQPGDWFRIYREKLRFCTGTFKVIYVDEKKIHVRMLNCIQQFQLQSVYLRSWQPKNHR